MMMMMMVIIILIAITIACELGLDRPVSASSNSIFRGLPSRICPFGILLLFILVTCLSQFDLYLLSFSSTGSSFTCSKIPSIDVSFFLSSSLRVIISLPYKRMSTASALYTFKFLDRIGLKILSEPSIFNFTSSIACSVCRTHLICSCCSYKKALRKVSTDALESICAAQSTEFENHCFR